MSKVKIRLDNALVEQGYAVNRSQAASLIMAGLVSVDDKVVDKAGYFIKPESIIKLKPTPRYVSRAGNKLDSVASKLKLDFRDKIVLDVGSSTGGFTDFALQHGAARVYCVDVGTNQLDWKLRNDERVAVMEKTDIRDVRLARTEARSKNLALPPACRQAGQAGQESSVDSSLKFLDSMPDMVVIDVSFISLRLVIPAVKKVIDKHTLVVPMVKPQFEADYKTASKHKGVIKNDTIRRQILGELEDYFRQDFLVRGKADSEVTGMKGNRERFFVLQLPG